MRKPRLSAWGKHQHFTILLLSTRNFFSVCNVEINLLVSSELTRDRRALEHNSSAGELHISDLEAQIRKASEVLHNANRRYDETTRRLNVAEQQVEDSEKRAAEAESRIRNTEAQLRIVQSALRARELNAEKAAEREASLATQLKVVGDRLREVSFHCPSSSFHLRQTLKVLENLIVGKTASRDCRTWGVDETAGDAGTGDEAGLRTCSSSEAAWGSGPLRTRAAQLVRAQFPHNVRFHRCGIPNVELNRLNIELIRFTVLVPTSIFLNFPIIPPCQRKCKYY